MGDKQQDCGVVILGGGIIGTSIAYHLIEKGITNITVVESASVAAAASGKAGGFLAGGWGDGGLTQQLHRVFCFTEFPLASCSSCCIVYHNEFDIFKNLFEPRHAVYLCP